ncbi:capsular biosynthesis protein [Psychrobacter sp. HD31]|uniref:capsule biosynthesis protein n=1 Tax=Psychrobacter sp. HD31 TaxID=3112003 RepID=UPI003DA4AF1E
MKTTSMQRLLTYQHVLLLQGKMGSSFSRFASFLLDQNIAVSKINFNAGDAFFYQHDNAYDYKGAVDEFDGWLAKFVETHDIDAIVCFGDCRPHHLKAAEYCEQSKTSFFVFEEGYLRPDYITFEEHGINGFSRLDVNKIHNLPKAHDKPLYTNNRFYRLCWAAIIYYIVVRLNKKKYPNYYHYRGLTAIQEAKAWIKAPYRKIRDHARDQRLLEKMIAQHKKAYFVCTLQVHKDTQITHHSDYTDVKDFINEVVSSFASHADASHHLVFKHHPLDRGHRDYRKYIAQLAHQLGVAERVHYGCDMHLPTLIRNSLGMVTVNSTTGLQSIYHKKPIKLMGRAIYNVEKLTDQKPLDEFWINPQQPDNEFYLRFREYLIEENQLNGSFYGKSPWMDEYQNKTKSVQLLKQSKNKS